MARRKRGRDVDGIVLLDKPAGLSSNGALQRVRKALDARKAGHTGSLDPLATGLLPICLGEATKLSSHLLGADKRYHVVARIGSETSTGDAEGEITQTSDVAVPNEAELQRILASFLGEQMQVPPMYSALKVAGKPLYQYAREGKIIERQPRTIRIHDIRLVSVDFHHMALEVVVSSGTYVRTLMEDIARAWQGCAHVIRLRRTSVGPLGQDDGLPMVDLETFEAAAEQDGNAVQKWLQPVSALIADWPGVALDDEQTRLICQGQAVRGAWVADDRLYKLRNPSGALLGIGVCQKSGELRPKRLFTRPLS